MAVGGKTSRVSGTISWFLLAIVVLGSGCNVFRKLRDSIHGEGEGPEHGKAGLRLFVDPRHGITISIDGARVGQSSPFEHMSLDPGDHTLEVRGMGFHTFVLPMKLEMGHVLEIPIALRKRVRQNTPPPRPTTTTTKALEPPAPPAPPTDPPAPEIPPGVKPITLKMVAQPPQEIRLDGKQTADRMFTFTHTRGVITFGEASLNYQLGGSNLLTFIIPDDGALWQVDGEPREAEARVQLHRGARRFTRAIGGNKVSLVLSRPGREAR